MILHSPRCFTSAPALPTGLTTSIFLGIMGVLLISCSADNASKEYTEGEVGADVASAQRESATLQPRVLATHPWNVESFTQGLEVDPAHKDTLIVGTGITGDSRIYRTTLDGQESDSRDLPAKDFGEGITISGDTVWQITWKNGIAYRRDVQTLKETGRVRYEGQGWGICAQKDRLIMSDGSGTLTFRDPRSFEVLGTQKITLNGQETTYLNELECTTDGAVWANIWQTDIIYRINPDEGMVTGVADLSGLFPAASRPGADVLNGIAAISETRFYLTGKYWDELYDVEFNEVD